jgi:hypothetical protein
VQEYNTALGRFPTNMLNKMFGFQPRPFFTSQPGAETAPSVNFPSFGSSPGAAPPGGPASSMSPGGLPPGGPAGGAPPSMTPAATPALEATP